MIGEGLEKIIGTGSNAEIDIEDFQDNQNNSDYWLHKGYKLNWAITNGSVQYIDFKLTIAPLYDPWSTDDVRETLWDCWKSN